MPFPLTVRLICRTACAQGAAKAAAGNLPGWSAAPAWLHRFVATAAAWARSSPSPSPPPAAQQLPPHLAAAARLHTILGRGGMQLGAGYLQLALASCAKSASPPCRLGPIALPRCQGRCLGT